MGSSWGKYRPLRERQGTGRGPGASSVPGTRGGAGGGSVGYEVLQKHWCVSAIAVLQVTWTAHRSVAGHCPSGFDTTTQHLPVLWR